MQSGVGWDLRLQEGSRAGMWRGLSVRGCSGGSSPLPCSSACSGGGYWATHLKPKSAHGEAHAAGV